MGGLIWTTADYGAFVFILLTALGAAAAAATGRALAKTWSPLWQIIPAAIVLAAAVRFLHFALFQEELLSLHYYVVTLVILLGVAWLGYKSMRATQMATQYPWAIEKAGIGWRDR